MKKKPAKPARTIEPDLDPFGRGDTADPFTVRRSSDTEWDPFSSEGAADPFDNDFDPFGPKSDDEPDDFPFAEPTDDMVADIEGEVEVIRSAFAERAKRETERAQDATDALFYANVVFANQAEADAFAQACGADPGARYILGATLTPRLKG